MKYRHIPGLSHLDCTVLEYMDDPSNSSAGGFMQALMLALTRADGPNTEKIRAGFPEVVASFERWGSGELTQIEMDYRRKHSTPWQVIVEGDGPNLKLSTN